jgi:hypothetical protein
MCLILLAHQAADEQQNRRALVSTDPHPEGRIPPARMETLGVDAARP